MDEPFSALDPLIRRGLQDEFLELSRTMRKTTIFITHDLDEAIRLGSRIAIMKDGEVVQIGTPEHIVTNPADDYVADFVQGISRLKLVFAHTIMEPPEKYRSEHGDLANAGPAGRWPIRRPILDSLVNLIIGEDDPIAVRSGDGQARRHRDQGRVAAGHPGGSIANGETAEARVRFGCVTRSGSPPRVRSDR